jgi:DnaD/phage-associated family protein
MLRLLLYFFWHFENQRGNVRFLKFSDLVSDPTLIKMIGDENILNKTLDSLVKRDILLQITPPGQSEMLYFINGPQGRAAVQAIKNGEWDQEKIQRTPIQMTSQRPNIFRLYEENIGPITPLMAEILKEDEKTYPDAWIPEAIEIAVTRNARNWKYVQAVLERWQKEGRGNEQNRRDDSQDPNRYRKSWLGRE